MSIGRVNMWQVFRAAGSEQCLRIWMIVHTKPVKGLSGIIRVERTSSLIRSGFSTLYNSAQSKESGIASKKDGAFSCNSEFHVLDLKTLAALWLFFLWLVLSSLQYLPWSVVYRSVQILFLRRHVYGGNSLSVSDQFHSISAFYKFVKNNMLSYPQDALFGEYCIDHGQGGSFSATYATWMATPIVVIFFFFLLLNFPGEILTCLHLRIFISTWLSRQLSNSPAQSFSSHSTIVVGMLWTWTGLVLILVLSNFLVWTGKTVSQWFPFYETGCAEKWGFGTAP